jgi:ankyrin repeat protein
MAENGHDARVGLLVEENVDVNARDRDNQTPLVIVVKKAYPSLSSKMSVALVDEVTTARIFIDIGEVHGVQVGEEYGVYQHSALGLDSDPIIA